MKILQISDTHNKHRQLTNLPAADVIVHCGDITENGTEEEALDFLNWFMELSYPHKIFVTGNHDLCLRDAEGIEDLPDHIHFLQDCGCEIDGIRFFGLSYDHEESIIPMYTDIVITHEPPTMILDESDGIHWGNIRIQNRVREVKPRYHLFGHAHDGYGIHKQDGIIYSNGSLLDEQSRLCHAPKVFQIGNR
ncbi:MAG: metallophosphatase domain-containing protein [Bacteroidales bacterium]|jgi:Icc-related predicted phosphoesterase|nr:metallophosphatase domain-containing protein [Bacteroidales bacterium]